MIRLYVLVEGQTEEAFINELVVPHYAALGIYFTPVVVQTSPGYRGGLASFGKVKPQIQKLCKCDANAYVTTMFDLYGLPHDFPGKSNPIYRSLGNGRDKAQLLESELMREIELPNFIPNLTLHEFETLLFVNLAAFTPWTDSDHCLAELHKVRGTTAPEDINDGPSTAPSKRIKAAMPRYQKTFHGPLIAIDIGLDAMRRECPHFDAWLAKIEALNPN